MSKKKYHLSVFFIDFMQKIIDQINKEARHL